MERWLTDPDRLIRVLLVAAVVLLFVGGWFPWIVLLVDLSDFVHLEIRTGFIFQRLRPWIGAMVLLGLDVFDRAPRGRIAVGFVAAALAFFEPIAGLDRAVQEGNFVLAPGIGFYFVVLGGAILLVATTLSAVRYAGADFSQRQ